MSNIQRGCNIPDKTVTRFIDTVADQVALVGVSFADIVAIAKVLERSMSELATSNKQIAWCKKYPAASSGVASYQNLEATAL